MGIQLILKHVLRPESVFLPYDFKRHRNIPEGPYSVRGLGPEPCGCGGTGPAARGPGAQRPHRLGRRGRKHGLGPWEGGKADLVLRGTKEESKAQGDK